jgi:hypothetical protein
MNRRKIAGFACALTLAAPVGLMLGTGSATGATTPAQTCGSLKGTATISPGLTFTPATQTVVANGTLASCTPSTSTGGGGTMHTTTTLNNASCTQLASGTTLPLKGTITWKKLVNGKHVVSGVSVSAKTTSSAPTVATLTGKVTSGLFLNAPVTGTISFTLGAGQDCSVAHPVKTITFKNTDANNKVVPFKI